MQPPPSSKALPDGSHRNRVWFSIIRENWPATKSLLQSRLTTRP
jgi:hypothetical protein